MLECSTLLKPKVPPSSIGKPDTCTLNPTYLVCAVQKWEQPPPLDDLGDPVPLLRGGVDASGVVGAGVKDDHGGLGGGVLGYQ